MYSTSEFGLGNVLQLTPLLGLFSKLYVSPEGVNSLHTVGGEHAKHYLNKCPTHSLWFERFLKGCLSCIGWIVKQDMAIPLPLMHALMNMLNGEWTLISADWKEKMLIASIGTYAVVSMAPSGQKCS
jgi:hypothetical protein